MFTKKNTSDSYKLLICGKTLYINQLMHQPVSVSRHFFLVASFSACVLLPQARSSPPQYMHLPHPGCWPARVGSPRRLLAPTPGAHIPPTWEASSTLVPPLGGRLKSRSRQASYIPSTGRMAHAPPRDRLPPLPRPPPLP
jgi:hypothetical protein